MATLFQQLKKSEKINESQLTKILFDFIRNIEKELTDLNKEQIFKNSSDVHGKAIGFYSEATEKITGGKKKAGDPFTGKDTGDWFSGFFTKIQNDSIFFGSYDSKTLDILTSRHWLSHDLFGLTDDNLNEVIRNRILPFFLTHIRQTLDI